MHQPIDLDALKRMTAKQLYEQLASVGADARPAVEKELARRGLPLSPPEVL